MDKLYLTRHDQSNEVTRTGFNVPAMNATNFDTHQTLANDIASTMDAICKASATRVYYTQSVQKNAKDRIGNREMKWLVRYTDTVTFVDYTFEVGCADDDPTFIINQGNGTYLDPASDQYQDFAGAVNAFAVSPHGNPISVYEIELVGRNL